ncbi:hypothetical protein EVAR_14126_1 [Eumeta japonica]|uniref:Uncharacterized protein n=1 Tax=Eumeta variegata TaxID=151549 RepID=A0A4C1UE86_EUMVA|nr:hypothetical protein EVAR_14126_1 [Eumeta japonica]
MLDQTAPTRQRRPRVRDKRAMRCRVRPLSLFYSDIGRWSGREIARPRSAQTERDNELRFVMRADRVRRFIRRYHVKKGKICISSQVIAFSSY